VSADLLTAALRELVQEEVTAAVARLRADLAQTLEPAKTSGWMTPPAAARALGVGVKRVRAAMGAGLVEKRPRNLDPRGTKQTKWEVLLPSLEKALGGEAKAPEHDVWNPAALLARRGAA
jgi:hypothetical protein